MGQRNGMAKWNGMAQRNGMAHVPIQPCVTEIGDGVWTMFMPDGCVKYRYQPQPPVPAKVQLRAEAKVFVPGANTGLGAATYRTSSLSVARDAEKGGGKVVEVTEVVEDDNEMVRIDTFEILQGDKRDETDILLELPSAVV